MVSRASNPCEGSVRKVNIMSRRRSIRSRTGLKEGPDTLTIEEKRDGFELDLVTHDVKKFFGLLLRRNGYVLEQLFSPLGNRARVAM